MVDVVHLAVLRREMGGEREGWRAGCAGPSWERRGKSMLDKVGGFDFGLTGDNTSRSTPSWTFLIKIPSLRKGYAYFPTTKSSIPHVHIPQSPPPLRIKDATPRQGIPGSTYPIEFRIGFRNGDTYKYRYTTMDPGIISSRKSPPPAPHRGVESGRKSRHLQPLAEGIFAVKLIPGLDGHLRINPAQDVELRGSSSGFSSEEGSSYLNSIVYSSKRTPSG